MAAMAAELTNLDTKLGSFESAVNTRLANLEEATSNKEIQRVRKADVLALRAELEQKSEQLAEYEAQLAAKDAEIAKLYQSFKSA